MDIFLQIVYTILVLGFLIFVHELGHFIFAKIFKVQVNEFSLGMGPLLIGIKNKKFIHLFSKNKDEEPDGSTAYSLRLLPIGGYVSMEGEDEDSDNPDAFNKKPVWKRIIITFAGAFMNLVIALLITLILVVNLPNPSKVVAEFNNGATSQASGLQEGDEIIKINDTKINNYADIAYALQSSYDLSPVDVTVLRNDSEILIENVQFPAIYSNGDPVTEENENKLEEQGKKPLKILSVDFKVYALPKTVPAVIQETFSRTFSYVETMYRTLFDLVTGKVSFQYLSGPVGTSTVIKQAADYGFMSVLSLTSLISINLAVFNMLPFPALDGGRIVFQLIELIFKRKVNPKVEAAIHAAGLILLFGVMIIITFKDIIFPVL